MKTVKRLIATTAFIAAICVLNAQSPPPPNGGNNPTPGNGNTPVGGGAPIGSGVILLISLAAGYGGKKVYDFRKSKLID